MAPDNPKLFEGPYPGGTPLIRSEITLLDLFAGMALHSLIAASDQKKFRDEAVKRAKKAGMPVCNYIARDAYRWGENMLEERDKIMKGESSGKL